MCAFVPVNIPIAGGMIMASSTVPQLIFQWLNQVRSEQRTLHDCVQTNSQTHVSKSAPDLCVVMRLQSYNSGFNYANRNATVSVNQNEIMVSYGLAVTVACGSAVIGGRLASRLSKRAGISAMTKMAVNRVVPWFAVAAAGSFNALAMRYKEGLDGIEVRDAEGTVRGVSKSAGVAVLSQVVATRVVLPIPVILLPPFLSDAVRTVGVVGRAVAASAALGIAIDLAVITACLWLALPMAIAIFPQDASIPVTSLEPEFAGLVDSQGKPVTHLTCNKGV
jgi:hypothetical protein